MIDPDPHKMSNAKFSTSSQHPNSSAGGAASSNSSKQSIREILPRKGYLHCEDSLTFVLCKPKLLPLKSFTMEKLEKVQADAVEKAKMELDASSLD